MSVVSSCLIRSESNSLIDHSLAIPLRVLGPRPLGFAHPVAALLSSLRAACSFPSSPFAPYVPRRILSDRHDFVNHRRETYLIVLA